MGQATGLIPPSGASPLRDSAGISPDFAGVHVPPHLRGTIRLAAGSDTVRRRIGAQAVRPSTAATVSARASGSTRSASARASGAGA